MNRYFKLATALVLSMCLLNASTIQPVFSLEVDRELNDIRIWDPLAQDPITCEGGGSLIGSNNMQKIFNYLSSKGLSDIQVGGAVGNIYEESKGDPTILQVGGNSQDPADAKGGGYGIIQWTPGKRLVTYISELKITGEPYLLQTQLDVLWQHMTVSSPTGVSKMIDNYKTIDDIREATLVFHKDIEGSADDASMLEERIASAENLIRQYGSQTTGPSTPIDPEGGEDTAAADPCADGANGNAVKTAMNYAWPEPYPRPHYEMKPSYRLANDRALKNGEYTGGGRNKGIDCGGFVTRVMRNSGVDTEYNNREGNTTVQQAYLSSSPKYKRISASSSADLLPGDIAIRTEATSSFAHTYIFVGPQAEFKGGEQVAESSIGDQSNGSGGGLAPQAGFSAPYSSTYQYYRFIATESSTENQEEEE